MLHAGEALRKLRCTVQIESDGNVTLAAEVKKMVEMTAEVFKRCRAALRQERADKIQTCRAAELADGAELLVGQIADAAAHGGRVGVAGHDRLFRQLRHVPEAALREMAHIHDHPEPLCAAEKVLTLLCQTRSRFAGAGQGVINVPDQRDHPHALFIRLVQPSGVAVDGLRALDREEGRRLSGADRLLCVLRRAAEGSHILIFVQLIHKVRQCAAILLGVGQSVLDPCGAERKKLGVAAERLCTAERDGAAVFTQCSLVSPKLDRGIAVSVKNCVVHSKASSKCRTSGFFVPVPSGA